MYRIIIIFLMLCSIVLPVGVIAEEVDYTVVATRDNPDVYYDFEHKQVFEVEGNSMDPLGFPNGTRVDVVPVSEFNVGDVIAFECFKDACNGAYIKRVAQKQGNCFWVEGRQDIWEENGQKKQSMDSRTEYGWLCNDDIDIYGVAFKHKTT